MARVSGSNAETGPRKGGTDTLFKLPKSESVPVFRSFWADLEKLVALNKARGIKMIFALEANSIEKQPEPINTHCVMLEVAEQFQVPVVDLHSALREKYDTGFLWWDFVHPTSYGHGLIADELFEGLRELGALEE